MIKTCVLPLILFASFCFASAASAQSAADIARKFEKEKIAALQKYLEENPEAADKDTAVAILVGAHLSIGDFKPVPDLLEQRYEAAEKGFGADVEAILQEIVNPYIQTSVVSDQRDRAKAFVSKVKSDFANFPMSGQINQILDQLSAKLYLPGVGDTMELAFTDVNGHEVDLAKMEGKIVLVDFWATWCPPCVAEMPQFKKVYDEYHEKGFEIIGISLDDNKERMQSFLSNNEIPWPQYFDGLAWENELAQRYGISQLPATFLVGKDGVIVASDLQAHTLREHLAEQLGEVTPKAEPEKPEAKPEDKPEEADTKPEGE